MSRAERRQYQRMAKGQDPYAPRTPPGGSRPPKRRGTTTNQPRDWSFTRRFWIRSGLVAVVIGVVGLSVAWPSGAELALLVGAAAGALAFGMLVAARWFLKRSSARSAAEAGAR